MAESDQRDEDVTEEDSIPGVIGDCLDWFAGSWTEDEAREFDEAVQDFGRIDPELWN